jgi:hypothetical protein
MLLGWHNCTSKSITFGSNLLYHSILIYTLKHTKLYTWCYHTWQEHNISFHSVLCSCAEKLVQLFWSHLTGTKCIIPFWLLLLGTHTCTSDLFTIGMNLMYFVPFWPTILGRHTCTSDLNTLGRNLLNHSFLSYDLRQTYLYKWLRHTWKELNVSFHSDLYN